MILLTLRSPGEIATVLRQLDGDLRNERAASLPVRIRNARDTLTHLAALLEHHPVAGRDHVLHLLAQANTRLDRLEAEGATEVRLRWSLLDVLQAADWLETMERSAGWPRT